jgi:hypothetical protein
MTAFTGEGLLRQGEYFSYFSVPKYLALNAGAAVAGFGIIFSLTYLLSALAHRYWRWLNT